MTPKLKVDLKSAFCEKPGCKGPRHHRHHKGHEFLFVIRWQDIEQTKKQKEWIKRYWEFRKEDTVGLCPEHHAEIHLHYDRVIIAHNRRLKKPCDKYSYDEAEDLRKELVKACDSWLKKKTKGVKASLVFGRARTKNQRRKKDGGKKKTSGSD